MTVRVQMIQGYFSSHDNWYFSQNEISQLFETVVFELLLASLLICGEWQI
jgi:hypothetical protein